MKLNLPILVVLFSINSFAQATTQPIDLSTPDKAYAAFATAMISGDGESLRAAVHAANKEDQPGIDSTADWVSSYKLLTDAADKKLGQGAAAKIEEGLPIPSPQGWGEELMADLKRRKAVVNGDKASIDVNIGSGELIKIDGKWKVSTRAADGSNPFGGDGQAMFALASQRAKAVALKINSGEIKSVSEAIAAFNKD